MRSRGGAGAGELGRSWLRLRLAPVAPTVLANSLWLRLWRMSSGEPRGPQTGYQPPLMWLWVLWGPRGLDPGGHRVTFWPAFWGLDLLQLAWSSSGSLLPPAGGCWLPCAGCMPSVGTWRSNRRLRPELDPCTLWGWGPDPTLNIWRLLPEDQHVWDLRQPRDHGLSLSTMAWPSLWVDDSHHRERVVRPAMLR